MKNTKITKRISKDQELLVEQLKKTPVVQIACEKTSIGRSTYYRWVENYPEFARKAHKAIKEGEGLVSDLAESQLLAAIRDGNLTAVIFYLKTHNPTYGDRVELTHRMERDELSSEQKELVRKAITLTHDEKLNI